MTTEEQRDAQRQLWSGGNYSAVAERLAPITDELVSRVTIEPGTTVLDVAVGTGNTAIEAAHRGGRVTGIDLTPAQIDKAIARTARMGLPIDLQVADAEDLPFDDDSFDVVVSVMGMIFAPDPARATAELYRVCKPGGTVAVTAWANDGWAIIWRQRAVQVVPQAAPPGEHGPDAWGDSAVAVQRFRDAGLEVTASIEPFDWTFASIDAAVEFFVTETPPFLAFVNAAQALGRRDEGLAVLRRTMEETNQAVDGTCRLSAPYILLVATKPA
jgi:SAM-dependent methyltransferase